MITSRNSLVFFLAFCAGSLQVCAQAPELGETEFPNSGPADAQESFLRGLLLLHSFEYEDAREAFGEARRTDPDFVMAYWGEAMSHNHPIWFTQNTKAARGVLEALAPTREERLAKAPTARERDYLHAVDVLFFADEDKQGRDLAYQEVMHELHAAYPDDLDAASFYALSILGSSRGGRDYGLHMKAAAVAEEVFASNPRHPGAAHYLIHSYDDPVHAPVGLRAARVYAGIAPSAAHALHMPSHIFMAMGMWDEVASSNEDSWRAADERVERKNLGVNQRSFHALKWLCYGYLQQGRYDAAMETLHIVENDVKRSNQSTQTRRAHVEMRAAYVIETEQWDSEAANMEIDHDGLGLEGKTINLFAMGVIAVKRGDPESARQHLAGILDLVSGAKEGRSGLEAATVMQHELKALLLVDEGRPEDALALLKQAAAMEAAMAFDAGPPVPIKPSHELLGEMLLDAGYAAEAQEAFTQALARAPKRARSLLGLAQSAALAGDDVTAGRVRATLRRAWHRADAEVAAVLDAGAPAGAMR